MRSDDIIISVRNLTKTYRLFGHVPAWQRAATYKIAQDPY